MMKRSSPIRVLHVDDEPDFAELTANFLEREADRIAVETADSASEAVEQLADDDFDCVVSDYDMPGQNGIQLLETVRDKHPDLPFILYTGKGSEEVASDAISAGVTDYLQKGSGTSQYEVLSNRIQNAVEQRRAREQAAETEQRLQTIAENTNDILWQATADWDELLFINSPYEEIWGRSIAELREDPQTFLKGVHPDDRPQVEEAMDQLSAGEAIDIEFRVNAGEDFGRWVWAQGEPVFDDTGEVEKVVGFARDITERKAQAGRFEALIERSMDITTVIDADGTITYESPSIERILGYEPDELIGEKGFEYVHPDDRDRLIELFNEFVEQPGAAAERVTYRFKHADGSWRWLESNGRRVEQTGIDGFVLNSRDITARKERQRELQEQRNKLRRYERAIEGSTDLLAAMNTEYSYLFANARYRAYHGISAEELPGLSVPEVLEDQWETDVKPMVDRVLAGEEVRYETERQAADGETRRFEVHYYPMRDESGSVEGVVGGMRDITERTERDQSLEREKERFRTLFENTNDAVAWVEYVQNQPIIREANPAFKDLFEPPNESVEGRPLDEVVAAEDRRAEANQLSQRVQSGNELSAEITRDTVAGPRTFRWEAVPLEDPTEGEIQYAFAVYSDISGLRERERELERYETIIQALGDPVYVLDADGRYSFVNNAYVEETGYPREELIGEHVSKVLADEYIEKGQRVIEELWENDDRQKATWELERRTADGELVPAEIHVALLPTRDGEFQGTAGVIRDITERKLRQGELERQNERLEEFASVVSHDLRNPLGVAQGRLQLALEERDWAELEAVVQALDRMQTLIDNMLSLANAGEAVGEPEAVELSDLAADCWQTVETETARLQVDAELTIQADKTRLRQLLENLLRNAVEHCDDVVTVTIGSLPDGFYVEDDGPGIPPEERENVLDPGYSRREEGTGFGLSIVRDIAEAHDWQITVTEGADGGARFEFHGVRTA